MRRAAYIAMLAVLLLLDMWLVIAFLLGGTPRLFLFVGAYWSAIATVALAEELAGVFAITHNRRITSRYERLAVSSHLCKRRPI